MKRALPLILALALSSPLAVFAAETAHDHAHAPGAELVIELNNGQKWEIDAPLRKGMEGIQTAAQTALERVHANTATADDYALFNKQIGDEMAYIITNCKLEPKADEQLHGVLAQIQAGAEAAQGAQGDAKRADGVTTVIEALNAYGDYFDHSGWQKIDLGH